MSRIKRRVLWLAAVVGLVLTVSAGVAFTAIKRHQNTLRLIKVVKQGDRADEAEVRALLAGGADPNAPLEPPSLTLIEMLRLALKRSKPHGHEKTIFMFAAGGCTDRILRTLCDAGGDVRDREYNGCNAFFYAVGSDRLRNVDFLVQHGADVNGVDVPITPLIEALMNAPDAKDFLYLLAHGADPNGCNPEEEFPLLLAVESNRLEELRALLRAGAHVNVRDPEGQTALMWAAQAGDIQAITILLKAGADATLRDKYGKTAENIASAHSRDQAARFLHNHVARRSTP